MPVFALRILLSQFYFSYKRYLFESPKSPSLRTKIWAACRKLLSYTKPGLLSCNALLPKLPVPDLSQTVSRYLSSMEPLLSPEDFKLLVEKAKMFEKKEGWKLQWITKLYSLFTDNY
ncbi:hypothetical protein AB6A40_008056 [Gnathostoma spinigerum]|uniref:Choline/carnitine acyltransferase domain-containing protein n=1 Tax=Gnathostoma spinigerum TaxID=75299 RepID=A0ABD6EXE0_9BILA